MQYVICYDIADDRRRNRMARALLDYGQRIQESVFVANLDEELRDRMMERIGRAMEEREDTVHVFGMCGGCVKRVEVRGRAFVPKDQDFYIL